MFFGTTTFAEDSFSAQGSKSEVVALSGIALSTAVGTSTVSAGATVSVTGIALSSAIGDATISIGANAPVTGESLSTNIGTVVIPNVGVAVTGQSMTTAIGPYSIVAGGQTTIVVGAEALVETAIGTPVVSGSAI